MRCLSCCNALRDVLKILILSFCLFCQYPFPLVKHPISALYLANVPLCGKYSPVSLVFVLIFSIFVLYKRTETLMENTKGENER